MGTDTTALRALVKASAVFALTAGIAVLLGLFAFRPLLIGNYSADRDEQFERVIVGTGEADSIQRPKYWGEGPVSGPAFDPQDSTWPIAIEGTGFDFRIPGSWYGCRLSEPDSPGGKKVVCVEGSEGATDEQTSTGAVEVRPCRESCDPQTVRRKIEDSGEIPAPIKMADSTTLYYELRSDAEGHPGYETSMLHLFARDGQELDTQVVTRFVAPPEDKSQVQKIVNDVREAAP